jgi:transposase
MRLRCNRCGSPEQVKNGLMRTKQRNLCQAYVLNVTDTPARGKPWPLWPAALLLCVPRLVDEPHRQAGLLLTQ